MKKIKAIIKLQVPAGEASPAPPVGPILAPHGINLRDFCDTFNKRTQDKKGWLIPVEISLFVDGTFEFITKEPPTSQLLKKMAGIDKASPNPAKIKVGKISREQLKQIAQQKMHDLNTSDIEKAMKIIQGTASAMGIQIED